MRASRFMALMALFIFFISSAEAEDSQHRKDIKRRIEKRKNEKVDINKFLEYCYSVTVAGVDDSDGVLREKRPSDKHKNIIEEAANKAGFIIIFYKHAGTKDLNWHKTITLVEPSPGGYEYKMYFHLSDKYTISVTLKKKKKEKISAL